MTSNKMAQNNKFKCDTPKHSIVCTDFSIRAHISIVTRLY